MKRLASILYYVGGGVVFLGIVVLIWQNWSRLSIATKNIATLGTGIAAYLVGVLLSRFDKLERVGQSFYFVSALVMPVGLFVVFKNAGLDIYNRGIESVITAIILLTYLISHFAFRKNIFLVFIVIFGTWFFFSFTDCIVGGRSHFSYLQELEKYQTLMIGLTYLLLGYFFSFTERHPLTGVLYGFGIVGFLGAAFALGGWQPDQSRFWELIFPILLLGTMLFSVRLRSKSFLTFGALYLIAYIFKITVEYFRHSLGWPLILVLTGLAVIAIAFVSFRLHRRYLST